MTKRKDSMAARIRAAFEKKPTITVAKVAESLGVSKAYVHTVRSVAKRNAAIDEQDAETIKQMELDFAVPLPPPTIDDPVNHPSHYKTGGVETIDFIEAKGLGYHLGNVIKYITRAGRKGTSDGMEDLKKAQWYLNRAIEKNEINRPSW